MNAPVDLADTDTPRVADADPKPLLLTQLRAATAAAHARLDGAFGALDLMQRADLLVFLRAHRRGLGHLGCSASGMIEGELGIEAPDYRAMLDRDIAALAPGATETTCASSSPLSEADSMAAAGIAYVVTGSRLGLATLRKRGYWGAETGYRSAYMEDAGGIAVWRALAPYLSRPVSLAESREACTAALHAFDCYARAFADCRDEAGIESRNALHG